MRSPDLKQSKSEGWKRSVIRSDSVGWGSLHPSSSGFALSLGMFLVQQEGLGLSSGTAAGGDGDRYSASQ